MPPANPAATQGGQMCGNRADVDPSNVLRVALPLTPSESFQSHRLQEMQGSPAALPRSLVGMKQKQVGTIAGQGWRQIAGGLLLQHPLCFS